MGHLVTIPARRQAKRREARTVALMAFFSLVNLSWAKGEPTHTEISYPFDQAAILSLSTGELLAWNRSGRIAIQSAPDKWSQFQRTGDLIWDIVSDPAGILVRRSSNGAWFATLLGVDGHEVQRWSLEEGGTQVFTAERERWASTREGLKELRPDGTLGQERSYHDHRSGGWRSLTPYVYDGKRVFCETSSRTEALSSIGRCENEGDDKWTFMMNSEIAPVACGPWLMTFPERRSRDLLVHSFLTGEVMGRREGPEVRVAACTDEQTLVIGDRSLQEVELPSLRVLRHLAGKGAQISQIASVAGTIAYDREDSNRITLVQRSQVPVERPAQSRVVGKKSSEGSYARYLCRGRPRCTVEQYWIPGIDPPATLAILRVAHAATATTDEERCDRREFWLRQSGSDRFVASDCEVQWGADTTGSSRFAVYEREIGIRYVEFQSGDRCETVDATVRLMAREVRIKQRRAFGKALRDTCEPVAGNAVATPGGDGSRDHPFIVLHR